MAEEDDSWIYDSVVGFLNSPIWMVPIESFVDQHCLGNYQKSEDVEIIYQICELLCRSVIIAQNCGCYWSMQAVN